MAPPQKNFDHITNYKDLPSYAGILTHGPEAALSVPKDKALMALRLKDGSALMLALPSEHHKVAWFALRENLMKAGYVICGYATCTQDIFDMVLHDIKRLSKADAEQLIQDAAVIRSLETGSVPITWFKNILSTVMQIGASDLHIEFRGPRALMRVRLDGLMREFSAAPAQVAMDGVSAVFNIIAEERSRSEGSFNTGMAQQAMIPIAVGTENVNLRFQSHPAVEGLDVVMRILRTKQGSQAQHLDLQRLGYTPSQIETLSVALGSAWGGVFIAGITGSGKTTTLNTMLTQLAQKGDRKIVSIEDPVEYQVEGVSHLSIQRSVSGDEGSNPFKGAMMAFLRMDPDVGMFGEIRDSLSAEMALGAIQTGHKILTTVHATSALGVIGRLTSKALGLLRENVCSPEFISTLVYQVLTPINCPQCKVRGVDAMSVEDLKIYETYFQIPAEYIYCASEQGCPHCRKPNIDYSKSKHVGVKGVKVNAEVITPDEDMYLLLNQGKDIEARRVWRSKRKSGFCSPDMLGKEAWGHALYDLSQGLIDPYYFEMNFGSPKIFAPYLEK